MSEYTDELHAHLKELDSQGIPIPWELDIDGAVYRNNGEVNENGMKLADWPGIQTKYEECFWDPSQSVFDENAILMVEARNALPVLLEEIERLQAENAKLCQQVSPAVLEHLVQKACSDYKALASDENETNELNEVGIRVESHVPGAVSNLFALCDLQTGDWEEVCHEDYLRWRHRKFKFHQA